MIALVRAAKLIPEELVEPETSWFFNELGIESSYFLTVHPKKLAEHVLAIFGAKGNFCCKQELFSSLRVLFCQVSTRARNEKHPNLAFRNVEENFASFFHTSNKGLKGSVLEIELDDTFLDSKTDLWTLESYRSVGEVSTDFQDKLRCYFLRKVTAESDLHYLSPKLKEEHKQMMEQLQAPGFHGSVLVRSHLSESDACRIAIVYKKRVAK